MRNFLREMPVFFMVPPPGAQDLGYHYIWIFILCQDLFEAGDKICSENHRRIEKRLSTEICINQADGCQAGGATVIRGGSRLRIKIPRDPVPYGLPNYMSDLPALSLREMKRRCM